MRDDIKKGLLGIVVDETEVSKVMPEINSLTYRGYAAQDLCEYCRFEEVAYLILNKDLPNTIQLRQFEKEEKNNRELTKNLYEIIKHMPKKSHPMEGLTAEDVKKYIRFIANRRLSQLGLEGIYDIERNPLTWLDTMLNAVEHMNFFEGRATEYSKASTRGSWVEAFS